MFGKIDGGQTRWDRNLMPGMRCRFQVPFDGQTEGLCLPALRPPHLPLCRDHLSQIAHSADQVVFRHVPDDQHPSRRGSEGTGAPAWRDLQMRMAHGAWTAEADGDCRLSWT